MAHGRTETGLYYDAEQRRMTQRDKEMIPTRLVLAMYSLALIALLLVTYAVLTDRPLVGVAPDEPAEAVHVVTIEGTGNAARVTRSDGTLLLDTEEGAFIAAVRNGLERARFLRKVEGNPPVTITEWASGRMTLSDPASGWSMELSSFGAGNTRHFRRLFQ